MSELSEQDIATLKEVEWDLDRMIEGFLRALDGGEYDRNTMRVQSSDKVTTIFLNFQSVVLFHFAVNKAIKETGYTHRLARVEFPKGLERIAPIYAECKRIKEKLSHT